MCDNYSFLGQQLGHDFEDAMEEALRTIAKVVHANVVQDTREGTDAFVDGVRTDFTLDYDSKDKTDKVGTWGEFIVGVRKGNKVRKFKEPVLVLGLNANPQYARCIIPRVHSEIGDIKGFLDQAQSWYWEWVDRHPQYNM